MVGAINGRVLWGFMGWFVDQLIGLLVYKSFNGALCFLLAFFLCVFRFFFTLPTANLLCMVSADPHLHAYGGAHVDVDLPCHYRLTR